jgi:hypothetical protein
MGRIWAQIGAPGRNWLEPIRLNPSPDETGSSLLNLTRAVSPAPELAAAPEVLAGDSDDGGAARRCLRVRLEEGNLTVGRGRAAVARTPPASSR